MNEEELFCKLFPDYVVNNKPLSPYFDLFESGYEQAENCVEKLQEENAELKEKVSFLEDNLRVARKDREDLQLNVAKGLKEFVKDYPATSLRYLANEKYVEQLIKAKEIIKYLCGMVRELNKPNVQLTNVDYSLSEAEQFLNSEVEK